MKKRYVLFVSAVMAMMLICLSACGNSEEKQRQEDAMAAVSSGISARWDAESVSTNSFEDQSAAIEAGIKAEQASVSGIDVTKFEDENFKNLYVQYLASLEAQQEGIKGYLTDADLYNKKYVEEGSTIEKNCLKQFRENYGLNLGDADNKLKQELEQPDGKHISAGETVSLSSEDGDIELSVEKIVSDASDTAIARNASSITDKQYYGLLVCKVKNISFNDRYNPGLFELGGFVYLITPDGTTQTPLSTAYKNTGLNEGAGAVWMKNDVPAGQVVECVIPYALDNEVTSVMVRLASNDEVLLTVDPL